MKDFSLARKREEVRKLLDVDKISPEEADKRIAEALAGQTLPAQVESMTLSFDGKTFVFKETDPNDPGTSSVTLTTGQYTYGLHDGHGKVNYVFSRSAGISNSSGWLLSVPVVGASLPYVPLMYDGRVLIPQMAYGLHYGPGLNRLCYGHGAITYGKSRAMDRYVLGDPKGLSDYYVLSDHIKLNGRLIARKVRLVIHNWQSNEPDYKLPSRQSDFTLISSSDRPLSPDQFSPDYYCYEGCRFQEDFPNRKSKTIFYAHANGSLEQQLAAAPER